MNTVFGPVRYANRTKHTYVLGPFFALGEISRATEFSRIFFSLFSLPSPPFSFVYYGDWHGIGHTYDDHDPELPVTRSLIQSRSLRVAIHGQLRTNCVSPRHEKASRYPDPPPDTCQHPQ